MRLLTFLVKYFINSPFNLSNIHRVRIIVCQGFLLKHRAFQRLKAMREICHPIVSELSHVKNKKIEKQL